MREKREFDRVFIFASIIFAIALVFFVRLVEFQIIKGKSFREYADNIMAYDVVDEATRGEIIDRNGVKLVSNKTSFNVEFTKYFLEDEKLNDTILTLQAILIKHKDTAINPLPLQVEHGEFQYLENREEDIQTLLERLYLNQYATAQNAVDKLAEAYDLYEKNEAGQTVKDKYTKEELLTLCGTYYQMKTVDFSNFNPIFTFAEGLKIETVAEIKESRFHMPGVDVAQKAVREYYNSGLAPHTIGDVGAINKEEFDKAKLTPRPYELTSKVGKFGVERLMENELRGMDGKRTVVRSKDGTVVDMVTARQTKEGNTVQLTLDAKLQRTAEELLRQEMNNIPSSKGAAMVALDPRNGEILAIANYPSFDLRKYRKEFETYAKDTYFTPLLDRAATGLYRPGSAYKPAMVVAGVEAGSIQDENTSIYCDKDYHRFTDVGFRCLGNHGYTNSYRAIAVSCNIFFYETGYQIGYENLKKTSEQLGLGVETGYDLYEEAGGIGTVVNEGDIVQLAIGQGNTQVTPLQMAVYTATVANGGTRYKPQIIKRVTNFQGTEVISERNPEIKYQYVNQEKAFDITKTAMWSTSFTSEGTSYSAFSGFSPETATKTGSPQANNPNREIDHGAFIAFAPADNPEIAVAIIGEHVNGGRNLIPVVKGLLDAHFNGKYVE